MRRFMNRYGLFPTYDKTDPVVDILKEYVPEEKLGDAVDTLCICIENTKYAVFEQGFLRGIAAEKGGNI